MQYCESGSQNQTLLLGSTMPHLDGCHEGDQTSNDWTFIIRPGCMATVFNGEVYSRSNYINITSGMNFGVKVNYDIIHWKCSSHHHDGNLNCSVLFSCPGLQALNCDPKDEWNTVLECDATGSNSTVGCKYTKTVGTTMSNSTSNSFTADASLSESF